MTSRSRKLLAPALSLSFLVCAFRFGSPGATWFWAGQPVVPVALGVGAVTLWTLLLLDKFGIGRHRV